MVSEQDSKEGEGLAELSDELEEELCKVWDMAMDKVHLITSDVVCVYIQYLICVSFLKVVGEGFWPTHMRSSFFLILLLSVQFFIVAFSVYSYSLQRKLFHNLYNPVQFR